MISKQFPETVFEDTYQTFINVMRKKKLLHLNDIVRLTEIMQENEMDIQIVFAGQNGTGKSYANLMFCKAKDPKHFLDNYYLADKTTDDVIQYYLGNEGTTLGIDELNTYLYYREHSSPEQMELIKTMEHARSNRIVTAGCARDPTKVNNNFRNGKMSVIIWLLDRFKNKSGSYGVVLVANPSVEGPDRFGLEYIDISSPSYEDLRNQFESLESCIGYVFIPNASKVLTAKEIEFYKTQKKTAMKISHLNNLIKRLKKKKITIDEFVEKTNSLRKILGSEIIDDRIKNISLKPKSLKDFLEED